MAVVACAECGGQVSTEARRCPHCGTPAPTKNAAGQRMALSIMMAIGAVAVALVCVYLFLQAIG